MAVITKTDARRLVDLGFKLTTTGSGCEALISHTPGDFEVWLTDLGGAKIPSPGEPVLIGIIHQQHESEKDEYLEVEWSKLFDELSVFIYTP